MSKFFRPWDMGVFFVGSQQIDLGAHHPTSLGFDLLLTKNS